MKKLLPLALCCLLAGCATLPSTSTTPQAQEPPSVVSAASSPPLQITGHSFSYDHSSEVFELYAHVDHAPAQGPYAYTFTATTFTGERYALQDQALPSTASKTDETAYLIATSSNGADVGDPLFQNDQAFYPENFESFTIALYAGQEGTPISEYQYTQSFEALGPDQDTRWRLFCVSDGPESMRLGLSPLYFQIYHDLDLDGATYVDMDYGPSPTGNVGKSIQYFDGYAVSTIEQGAGLPIEGEDGISRYPSSVPGPVHIIITSPEYALDCGLRVGMEKADVTALLAAYGMANAYLDTPITEITETSHVRWQWFAYDFTGYDSVITIGYLPLQGIGAGRALCLYFDETGILECMTSSFVGAG